MDGIGIARRPRLHYRKALLASTAPSVDVNDPTDGIRVGYSHGYGYLWDQLLRARRARFFCCPFFSAGENSSCRVLLISSWIFSEEDSRVKAITEDFLLRALNYSINLEWSLDGICSTFHSHPLCQSPTHCFLHPSTISLEICIWLH